MKFGWRIAAGVVLAALLILALQRWINYAEVTQEAEVNPRVGNPVEPTRDTAADGRGILDALRGTADAFHLAPDRNGLPPEIAPVLTVLPGGTIKLLKDPPRVGAPGPIRWSAVGIVLPVQALVGLSPSERSSLLLIWTRLGGKGRLEASRVVPHGVEIRAGEFELLTRWMR
jgi:hypothetical protein